MFFFYVNINNIILNSQKFIIFHVELELEIVFQLGETCVFNETVIFCNVTVFRLTPKNVSFLLAYSFFVCWRKTGKIN